MKGKGIEWIGLTGFVFERVAFRQVVYKLVLGSD